MTLAVEEVTVRRGVYLANSTLRLLGGGSQPSSFLDGTSCRARSAVECRTYALHSRYFQYNVLDEIMPELQPRFN